jgi:hypothetical protein
MRLIFLAFADRSKFLHPRFLGMYSPELLIIYYPFRKSCLLPINISQDKAELLKGVFGCTVGTYPFTYLELSMGTTKPKVEHFAPLVSMIDSRISATATWLTMAGRDTLVDMAISSIPIYTMCSIKMNVTNLHSIDRIRKTGLWRGFDVAGKSKPMVAWKTVTTPK